MIDGSQSKTTWFRYKMCIYALFAFGYRLSLCSLRTFARDSPSRILPTSRVPRYRNFSAFYEIGVGEHDGDVRFYIGRGNMAISCMRNASGHNYRNSSFIVDVAMGQIPRSTERISSYY